MEADATTFSTLMVGFVSGIRYQRRILCLSISLGWLLIFRSAERRLTA